MVIKLNQMTLREFTVGSSILTIFSTVILVLLSVKVGYLGWVQVIDLCLFLLAFNIISCLIVIAINHPISLFYIREALINIVLAGVGTYIWVVETISENYLIFSICLTSVVGTYVFCIYSYKKHQKALHTKKDSSGSAKSRWFGLAGTFGAAVQIISSDNGVLLLIATCSTITFSLMGGISVRLGIKRRWGKAAGAWNEV